MESQREVIAQGDGVGDSRKLGGPGARGGSHVFSFTISPKCCRILRSPGKYLNIEKKRGGIWRLQNCIFNL